MAAESKEDLQRPLTRRTTDQEAKYRGFKLGVIVSLTAMTLLAGLGGDIPFLLGKGLVALVVGCLVVGGYRGWEAYKKARYNHGESGASSPQPPAPPR